MDHSEARKKVCIICYRKASRGLSANDVVSIQNLVIQNYTPENPDLPCGICGPCHAILVEHRNGNMRRSLAVSDDYNAGARILTRSQPVCSCRICQVAKANGLEAKGLKKKRGRPSSATCVPEKKFKLCNNCFSKLYRGCNHSESQCKSKKQKLNNISQNVLSDSKTKQQVGANIVKEFRTEGTKNVQLTTLGTPLLVAIESSHRNSQLSVDDAISMQSNASLSDRQLFNILRDIRLKFGRKSVESDIRAILIKRKAVFSDLFTKEIINFKDSKGNSLQRPFVYCDDINEFVDRICLLRGKDINNMEDKVGFDDGKDVLKLTLSIYDPNNNIPMETLHAPVRVTRGQGISGSNNFKDTGVNKLFIIAAAPKTPENYDNCKIFIEKTKINNLNYHLSADLKLANICLGIMSHASLHPCPYCEGTRNIYDEDASIRTLETISENYNKWRTESGRKGTLKEYYNCSGVPLVAVHDITTPVIDIVPPPALHIKLGIVNKLFSELQKLYPELEDWSKSLYITREAYHGHTFEGNECNKLLANLDMLLHMLPPNLKLYHDCFVAFRDAMQACLGFTIDPLYREKVTAFEMAYKALNISITSKVHIMIRHVPDFIEMHKRPLGQFSEQVVESTHAKFHQLFQSYSIKDIHHTHFLDRFYRAIMHFNSYHI